MMKQAYTLAEFCSAYAISRTFLYELNKKGQGPRLMRVGRRCLISAEAAADWRKQMETQTGTVADKDLK
jgi:hypothetical protein